MNFVSSIDMPSFDYSIEIECKQLAQLTELDDTHFIVRFFQRIAEKIIYLVA